MKTGDYLKRRTLPEVVSPVPAGASLEYTYEYDEAGSVTDSVRTVTVPQLDAPEATADGPDAPSTPPFPELNEGPAPTTETLVADVEW